VLHLGSLPSSRNPESLWIALSELVSTNPSFASKLQINLTGKIDLKVSESIRKNNLESFTIYKDFVPHSDTPALLGAASVLLLVINNTPNARGILTNKFFEYLSSRRNILAIGPLDGDAAFILKEAGAGEIFDYDDIPGLTLHLLRLFDLYSKRRLSLQYGNIEKFARINLTHELTTLLNKLTH
jgi:hypothetical protein